MRTLALVLAAGLALPACGAPAAGAPAARAPLGVQSNGGSASVALRVSPRGPMTFATALRVTLQSELHGEPVSAELDTRGIRRVIEVRSDGSVAIEDLETATHYTITMMGSTRTGPEASAGPAEPDRYVLGDRGRRTGEVLAGPGASARAAPPSDVESEMQHRLESVIEPLLRAMEFPERALAALDEWDADGVISFGEVDPAMGGGATYRITQRIERFEGGGEARIAVISLEGSFEGSATGAGGGARAIPGNGAIAGDIRFRGLYTIAVADGFARSARVQFEGEARLGPEAMMRFPLRGEIHWDATPVAAH